MKRTICYLTLLAGICLLKWLPFSGCDAAKLLPVEVLCVQKTEAGYTVETDGESTGNGETLDAAFEDLKAGAESTVFLDTADYVLVNFTDSETLRKLCGFLRPGCAVYRIGEMPDLENIAQFLKTHGAKHTLAECVFGKGEIPQLRVWEGGMRLVP